MHLQSFLLSQLARFHYLFKDIFLRPGLPFHCMIALPASPLRVCILADLWWLHGYSLFQDVLLFWLRCFIDQSNQLYLGLDKQLSAFMKHKIQMGWAPSIFIFKKSDFWHWWKAHVSIENVMINCIHVTWFWGTSFYVSGGCVLLCSVLFLKMKKMRFRFHLTCLSPEQEWLSRFRYTCTMPHQTSD